MEARAAGAELVAQGKVGVGPFGLPAHSPRRTGSVKVNVEPTPTWLLSLEREHSKNRAKAPDILAVPI
jgi:hypothetical protein